MNKEAIKQALEVFGGCNWHDEIVDGDWADKAQNAIKALEEALKQEQGETLTWKNAAIRLGEELSSVGPDGYYDMTPEQWLDWGMSQKPQGKNSLVKQEQGEPVAWWNGEEGVVFAHDQICIPNWTDHYYIPLYTKPQTKEWVGLSGKEVNAIYSKIAEKVGKHWDEGGTTMMFPETLYDAIEAKLKERNT